MNQQMMGLSNDTIAVLEVSTSLLLIAPWRLRSPLTLF